MELPVVGHVLFGEQPLIARDALLLAALRSARAQLTHRLGDDPSAWAWGRLHSIRFRHALDELPGALELLDLKRLPRPGDGYTVNAAGWQTDPWQEADPWQQTEGASYREILDVADWDHSLAVNSPGQSGQPGSRHYSDLLPLWDAGEYFPLVYSRAAVEDAAVDRLLLLP